MPLAPGEFAAAITPCLTLVSGSGMTQDARTEWMHAAWIVLADVPADLLKRGIRTAMGKADHPSKVVAAVMADVREEWDRRRKAHIEIVAHRKMLAEQVRALAEYRAGTRIEGRVESTADILKRVWPAMADHETGRRAGPGLDPDRVCREPTRKDYLRMGVPADVLGVG